MVTEVTKRALAPELSMRAWTWVRTTENFPVTQMVYVVDIAVGVVASDVWEGVVASDVWEEESEGVWSC